MVAAVGARKKRVETDVGRGVICGKAGDRMMDPPPKKSEAHGQGDDGMAEHRRGNSGE